ncbi:MAG TPA: tRNA (guanosine(46)-N7)-methyltransferase TrmB [Planctomycetota bacterium]|nr:tRNA (guanosine(46)-N7)-methyltransferase TrmB [Planctomycetota bacterium]
MLEIEEDAAEENPKSEIRNPQPNQPKTPFELPPLEQLGEPADFARVYGRSAPLVVEIGCGGGRTIMSMAVAHPEWNCLGIEQAGEYYMLMRERGERRKIPNFRSCRIDAAYLISRFFANECVDQYHIYFPDPWPKKRHRKRRLFSESFCADLKRTLKPGCPLFFATDHAEYYSEILPRLRTVLDVKEHPEPWEDAPQGRTNFEVKYMKAGRPIYRLVATKS